MMPLKPSRPTATQHSVAIKCVMCLCETLCYSHCKTSCLLRNAPLWNHWPQTICNKGGLLAVSSSAALYAKQPVLLPTHSLLVFTNRALQWSTHAEAYRGGRTYIHIHVLYPQDCCYQYSAHCAYCRGSSYPTACAHVSPPILHTPLHMQIHTHSHIHTVF